jgi:hypothetical protein
MDSISNKDKDEKEFCGTDIEKNLSDQIKYQNIIGESISLGLLVLTFSLMSLWSWLKWADILVDFGRELYIPWQIVSGKVLYKDIAHFFGPFSQYFNALIFKSFGVSYKTLILANLTLTGILTFIIYKIIKDAEDQICATFSSVAFLTIFSFSQYEEIASFNFVTPYAHEATHGVIFIIIEIYSLWKFITTKKNDLSFFPDCSLV